MIVDFKNTENMDFKPDDLVIYRNIFAKDMLQGSFEYEGRIIGTEKISKTFKVKGTRLCEDLLVYLRALFMQSFFSTPGIYFLIGSLVIGNKEQRKLGNMWIFSISQPTVWEYEKFILKHYNKIIEALQKKLGGTLEESQEKLEKNPEMEYREKALVNFHWI
jgi:hypothetical protein